MAGQYPDAKFDEQHDAGFLRDQVAGKAVRALDDHHAHAVGGHAVEQRPEAWSRVDRVLAADGRIVELVDDLVASVLREAADRIALSMLACRGQCRRWLPTTCASKRPPSAAPSASLDLVYPPSFLVISRVFVL